MNIIAKNDVFHLKSLKLIIQYECELIEL